MRDRQTDRQMTDIQTTDAATETEGSHTKCVSLIKHLTNSPKMHTSTSHTMLQYLTYLIFIPHCSPVPIDPKHLSICIYFVYALIFV